MNNKYLSITIDGPAGSGKSTIAKKFAEINKEFTYINTGLMFRAVAYFLLMQKIDISNEKTISNAIKTLNINLDGDNVYIFLNNKILNITDFIRTSQISKLSSEIAKLHCVREKLMILQREIASKQNVIMDGRDIGSKVLPNANIKIYLDASIETRAIRRQKQLKEIGINVDLNKIKIEIQERDENDKNRTIAPLIKPINAIVINTTNKEIDDVIEIINNLYLSIKNK